MMYNELIDSKIKELRTIQGFCSDAEVLFLGMHKSNYNKLDNSKTNVTVEVLE
ncbi:MAG: hypothetical protein ABIO44_06855 [Saprospiraceae bacterium]